MPVNEMTLIAYANTSWIWKVQVKTYDAKRHKAVPINLTNMFLVLNVYNFSGGLVASSYTDMTSSSLACATSGLALLQFPLSATSAVSASCYTYNLYIADMFDLTSATYKTILQKGPLEVKKIA